MDTKQRIGVVLLVVGAILLFHPLYLSSSGERVNPTFETVNSTECASSIEFHQLPQRAQHSFNITSHGDLPRFSDTLYPSQDGETIRVFQEYDCIRKDNEYYDVYLIHRDGTTISEIIPGSALYLAGILAIVAGVVVGRLWKFVVGE